MDEFSMSCSSPINFKAQDDQLFSLVHNNKRMTEEYIQEIEQYKANLEE